MTKTDYLVIGIPVTIMIVFAVSFITIINGDIVDNFIDKFDVESQYTSCENITYDLRWAKIGLNFNFDKVKDAADKKWNELDCNNSDSKHWEINGKIVQSHPVDIPSTDEYIQRFNDL